MNQLQTIQKTFRVFQTLAAIAKTLCIVGAVLSGTIALCISTEINGGNIFTLFGEPIKLFADGTGMQKTGVECLTTMIAMIAKAILLTFAGRYFKIEQADGTPFSESGATELKRLGIRCIIIPIIATAIAASIAAVEGVQDIDITGDFPGIVTGLILILASIIFSYGASLENRK